MTFAEALRELGVECATDGRYCRPGWVQFRCPFCVLSSTSDPNKLYAGFNSAAGYVNCWRCGPHSAVQTVVELSGKTWGEVRSLLGDLDLDRKISTPKRGKLKLPKGVGELLHAHREYLRGRKYDVSELEQLWGIRGIGIASHLSWRIFIPIMLQGEVVSFTTRSLLATGTRYISAGPSEESVDHRDLLYGEDYCGNAVVVHEGPFDVWRTGPGSVATLGTSYSKAQVRRIARYPRRVVCFDNEPDAQRRARKLCSLVEVFPGETYNVVLKGKDASASSRKEIRKLRRRFLEF